MANLFSREESKVAKQISLAAKEIKDYLNAGESLKRWEYFIKCVTRTPGASAEYRTADPRDDLRKMARFQPGPHKVLQRILGKYGMEVFALASALVFAEGREYPYFKEAYGIKLMVRV